MNPAGNAVSRRVNGRPARRHAPGGARQDPDAIPLETTR